MRCRERAAALGAREDTIDAVAIAVSEAVSNAVIHAYAGVADGVIDLQISGAEDALEIVVRDTGPGLGHARSPGGLGQGLLIIEQLTDTLRVTTAKDGGTSVLMRFCLP
ncbi:Serine-protein kinase RsbW [Paraconexibacter sp. AEG42_29]|uniref:Serine-protein kinase RsbW n=2 Tax=Paraconexibacter sp. AEG42_29 TaxID=2997339 RepID=A0AAU7AU20_9ACTN